MKKEENKLKVLKCTSRSIGYVMGISIDIIFSILIYNICIEHAIGIAIGTGNGDNIESIRHQESTNSKQKKCLKISMILVSIILFIVILLLV